MPNIIQKGFRYLKTRGAAEFIARAAEKYADARFDYSKWIAAQSITPARAGFQKNLRMKEMPAVYAMIVPEGKGEEARRMSARTAESVRRQTYRKKEICETLTTNILPDDLIVVIHAGDILPEQTFFELVSACQDGARFLYTDEDCYQAGQGVQGGKLTFSRPLFKPDFNPDYLRSMNYIGSMFAVRGDILRRAAKMSGQMEYVSARALTEPAAFYEMILLGTDLSGRKIVHIPKVLCHSPVPEEVSEEDDRAMRMVLKRDLERRRLSGVAEHGPFPGTFHVRYLPDGHPLVSIVIPNKDHIDILRNCLDSIHTLTTWESLEAVIVENNSEEEETFDFYDSLKHGVYRDIPVRVVKYGKKGFHFSEIINAGVRAAEGNFIVLMNNDVTVRTPDWIERLLGDVQREGVGAAGPKLLYPDKTVQSAGIVTGIMGFAGSMMVGAAYDDPGYMNRACVMADMSAVTAACMMVKRSAFLKVGGFSGKLAVALNDVDFCLRLREAGFLVVFDPSAVLCHHESKSRGYEDTKEKKERFEQEKKIFRERWGKVLLEGDPCYNPNLSLRKCDYSQKK